MPFNPAMLVQTMEAEVCCLKKEIKFGIGKKSCEGDRIITK